MAAKRVWITLTVSDANQVFHTLKDEAMKLRELYGDDDDECLSLERIADVFSDAIDTAEGRE